MHDEDGPFGPSLVAGTQPWRPAYLHHCRDSGDPVFSTFAAVISCWHQVLSHWQYLCGMVPPAVTTIPQDLCYLPNVTALVYLRRHPNGLKVYKFSNGVHHSPSPPN